ncbi:hypothetical protein GQX74_005708 [Glossina fuscipes]|nr:hypothetical protein GQX74_005708 [Glossina fuscipes]
MGTQVLTGLVIMATSALGHFATMALVISFTVQALILKRSSRDMPGLRGAPADTTTTSTPANFFHKHFTKFNLIFLKSTPTNQDAFTKQICKHHYFPISNGYLWLLTDHRPITISPKKSDFLWD